MKFYKELEPKKRQSVKETLLTIKHNRLNQIKLIDEMFNTRIKGQIRFIDLVLSNDLPIEEFIKRNEEINKYLTEQLGKLK